MSVRSVPWPVVSVQLHISLTRLIASPCMLTHETISIYLLQLVPTLAVLPPLVIPFAMKVVLADGFNILCGLYLECGCSGYMHVPSNICTNWEVLQYKNNYVSPLSHIIITLCLDGGKCFLVNTQ